MEVFVRHFERFRGFLNTFSKKWRRLFRNERFLKENFREVEASVYKCGAFVKISIILEDFFREFEAFSRIANTFLVELKLRRLFGPSLPLAKFY
jgi:hypothetical protein